MHMPQSPLASATFALSFIMLGASAPVLAQVAGASTTSETTLSESTQVAMGWSVKKSLMGKTVYNDAGRKVGKVEDLIISPERSVSYVIVGAGGFIGMGRHDVAVPVTGIQDQSGRLVMAGATEAMIKAMPAFAYAQPAAGRERFIEAAGRDIASGKARVVELETRASVAAVDAKAKIDLQISELQLDLKSAEAKLNEMKQASAARWKELEGGVNAATARLRKSIDKATG